VADVIQPQRPAHLPNSTVCPVLVAGASYGQWLHHFDVHHAARAGSHRSRSARADGGFLRCRWFDGSSTARAAGTGTVSTFGLGGSSPRAGTLRQEEVHSRTGRLLHERGRARSRERLDRATVSYRITRVLFR